MPFPLDFWTIGSFAIGILVLSPFLMGFFGGNKFEVRGKTVLLTGASEGMGKSVAIQLAQKGANIVIVARNVTKLEQALGEITAAASSSSQQFKYISADVSKPDAALRIIAEATAWNNGQSPDIVWCIAGSAYPALFIETPLSRMRQQMDINFWSGLDMAHGILNEWLKPEALESDKKKGQHKHLVFTSSAIAFYPIAGYAPYSPAKAALRNLSDALVQEVLLYGGGDAVKVHTVFPGTISTAGLETENKTKPEITLMLEETDPIQTADAVAAKSIKGLENGEYLIAVNWLGAAMRGCAWGGSMRNNWVLDTIMTWITSIVWLFVGPDLDGKVRKYGKENGHPSTYAKRT